MIRNYKLTQNLGFSIPFHLYVHAHDFEQAFRTHTSGVNMYVPPPLPNGYISWYLVTFLWLKLIRNNKLTQNLGFSIPFHLYVHAHDFEQAFRTHIRGVNMYVPPLLPNGYISWYLVTFL